MVEFTNRIRELRQQKGWTAEDLAKVIGSTHATVSRLEQNKQALTTDWIYKIAFALGVRPADILQADDTFTFAFTRGDLRLDKSKSPLFPPDQVYPMAVPLFDKYLKGKSLDAFQASDNSWLIAERLLSLDRQGIGKKYVLLIVDDRGKQELSLRTLEDSAAGAGFVTSVGDPTKRWIRLGDSRIKSIWHALAEYRGLQ